jgi:hypothetical protein
LIIDLKVKISNKKYINEDLDSSVERLKKIKRSYKKTRNRALQQNREIKNSSKLELLFADVETKIMEIVIHNFKEELIEEDNSGYYSDAMSKAYKIYDNIISKEEEKNEFTEEFLTDAYLKFANFAESVLSCQYDVVDQALSDKNIDK